VKKLSTSNRRISLMEANQILLFILLPLIICILLTWLISEKRRSRKFARELAVYQGKTQEEMVNMGKYSELGLMSAGIAHEISNPLSIILGRVEQLIKRGETSDKESLLKGFAQIQIQAERIGLIIQSWRNYIYRNETRIEDFISLKDLIKDVTVFCGQRLKNHGIELRLKHLDGIYVSGHKGQFEQAILNLMTNSFDAIDNLSDKWIEISAKKSHDVIQITFTDSGSGISEDVKEKMLDPFFSTKNGKGTGLGLTLVKGIAERHGGDLKYIEAPHTTFILELPEASVHRYQ
jgi:signal transduction histidine kinase